MNIKTFTGFLLLISLSMMPVGCGKKGSPSLPQKSISQDGTGISGFMSLNDCYVKILQDKH
jgi:hypothetical protein